MVMKHEKKALNCFPGRKGEKENKMLPFQKYMLCPQAALKKTNRQQDLQS